MPVEGFHTSEQLFVVSAVDKDLSVVFHGLGEYGEWAGVELFFLLTRQFLGSQLRLWFDESPIICERII